MSCCTTDSLTANLTIALICSSPVKLPVIPKLRPSAELDESLGAGNGHYLAIRSESLEAHGEKSVAVVGTCMESMG